MAPLPHHVHRMGEPGERSFSIQPVKAEMKDTRRIERIADRFDAELRTGRHDALFCP